VVEQHVRVEVAPAELPHERGRPLARAGVARPLLQLARGDAAGVHALAPHALAGRERLRQVVLEPQLRERLDRPGAHAAGRERLRGAPWTSRRSSCRHAFQNGVKTVNGWPSLVRGASTSATNRPGWRTTSASSAASTRRSRRRERGDVGGEVHGPRAGLPRQLGQLALRRAAAHDEVRAALSQRRPQVREAAEQEVRPRAGREAAVQQRAVEHEDRHDMVRRAGGGGQRGVVVDAQVAPEPDDRGGGHLPGYGAGARRDHP
jgi:hypothetical protein